MSTFGGVFDHFDRSELCQTSFLDVRRLLSNDHIFPRGFLKELLVEKTQENACQCWGFNVAVVCIKCLHNVNISCSVITPFLLFLPCLDVHNLRFRVFHLRILEESSEFIIGTFR